MALLSAMTISEPDARVVLFADSQCRKFSWTPSFPGPLFSPSCRMGAMTGPACQHLERVLDVLPKLSSGTGARTQPGLLPKRLRLGQSFLDSCRPRQLGPLWETCRLPLAPMTHTMQSSIANSNARDAQTGYGQNPRAAMEPRSLVSPPGSSMGSTAHADGSVCMSESRGHLKKSTPGGQARQPTHWLNKTARDQPRIKVADCCRSYASPQEPTTSTYRVKRQSA
jgi:hypothetical protein